MASLKELRSYGMRDCSEEFDESTLDKKNSTVEYPDDESRHRQYWNDNTFPDATMKEVDLHTLKEATHAELGHMNDIM
jgi:hypothetical protein